MKKFPVILRWVCRRCQNRDSHIFDSKELVEKCDINGTHIAALIPGFLWYVDWCKLYKG